MLTRKTNKREIYTLFQLFVFKYFLRNSGDTEELRSLTNRPVRLRTTHHVQLETTGQKAP